MAETADPLGFSAESQALARELFRSRLRLGSLRAGLFVIAVLAFLALGWSLALREWALEGPAWAAVFRYVSPLYLGLWALGLPFAGYAHVLDRRYGLSRQGWLGWALDDVKAGLLGYGFAFVAVAVLYWLLAEFPGTWWIIAWGLGLAFALLASVVVPVLLVRVFFRLERLNDSLLEERFRELAKRAGVLVIGVFVLRASAKTARSNAALAGFGRARRVIVTDTLLSSHTPDEIETILAHELAHQKHRDFAIGLGVFASISLIIVGLLQVGFPWATDRAGLQGIADLAGLPILMLLTAAISTVLGPLDRSFSRWREARADRLALDLTLKPEAFAAAFVKLHDANLSLARPPRLFELLMMTHPAGWRRVSRARTFHGRALK